MNAFIKVSFNQKATLVRQLHVSRYHGCVTGYLYVLVYTSYRILSFTLYSLWLNVADNGNKVFYLHSLSTLSPLLYTVWLCSWCCSRTRHLHCSLLCQPGSQGRSVELGVFGLHQQHHDESETPDSVNLFVGNSSVSDITPSLFGNYTVTSENKHGQHKTIF